MIKFSESIVDFNKQQAKAVASYLSGIGTKVRVILEKENDDSDFWIIETNKQGVVSKFRSMAAGIRLAARLQREAVKTAEARRFYTVEKMTCVAVPLLHSEEVTVAEYAADEVSRMAGEGEIRSDRDGVREYDFAAPWRWSDEALLPRYEGLLMRYTYDDESGTNVRKVWGLLRVKM